MIRTFTPNDVIRLVYGEPMAADDRQQLEYAIISDNELADTFYQTQSTKDVLNATLMEPSVRAIDAILNFSRSLAS